MTLKSAPSLAPPSVFYSTDAIILHVGPREQAMLAHEDCLRGSDFFRAAMKKEWLKGQTRIIKLPDECPKLMAHYLGFLYGSKLPTHAYNSENTGGLKSDAYELLARLYVLGEHLLDSTYRNALIDEILRLRILRDDGRTHSPTTVPVNIIFQGTLVGSPARRLLVDLNLRHGGEHWHTSAVDPAFLFDFMQAYFRAVKGTQAKVEKLRRVELKAEEYYV